MTWWNRTKLGGFRARWSARLHRFFLPYLAVLQADLFSFFRSWMLRAWLSLTVAVALLCLIRNPVPNSHQTRAVVSELLQTSNPAVSQDIHTLRLLLMTYIALWTTFVIILTAGAISSELGVIADSILSRGASRWQYYLGKVTSRALAIVGSYCVIMGITGLVIWWRAPGTVQAAPGIIQAGNEPLRMDTWVPAGSEPSLAGLMAGLVLVGAVLGCIACCSVAASACFSSSIMAISVVWVTVYSTGVMSSLLEIPSMSLIVLYHNLPSILHDPGNAGVPQSLLSWLSVSLVVVLTGGLSFARRDLN